MDHGVGDMEFQSTLPVWGATEEIILDYTKGEFQSTLPVWGATTAAAVM